MMAKYDLVVSGGTLVVPYLGTRRADVAAKDGRIVAIADELRGSDADQRIDARGKLVFPAAVDAHFHIGIYRPIAEDTESETRAALVGGVGTVVSYFRTGGHYLNKSGPYRDIFPEVLRATEGHAYTDYAYHLAIMTSAQIKEVDWLVSEMGVASFKYYMFYKGLNLSASSTDTSSLTMSDSYDLGHLYRMMQAIAAAAEKYQDRGRVSLSLHCEQAEIMRTMIDEVRAKGIEGLEAYHLARPPFQERLAIAEATLLADVTGCPVNLLHLSSGEALAAGTKARRDYPGRDIRLETTLHHLALTYETAGGIEKGKVNPPIRTRADNDALWAGVLSRRYRPDRVRPRVLHARAEAGRHLGGLCRLRRNLAPVPDRVQRGPQARPLAAAGGGAHQRESRTHDRALSAQGDDRRGRRCRSCDPRPRARGVGHERSAPLGPGPHRLRRLPGHRLADPHGRGRPGAARGGEGRRATGWPPTCAGLTRYSRGTPERGGDRAAPPPGRRARARRGNALRRAAHRDVPR